MKAPEKLYLRKRNKLPLEVVRDKWYEADPQSLYGSVEYTRTDAFIEKAVRILEHYLDNSVWVSNDVGVREKEVIIEDFEEYLRK